MTEDYPTLASMGVQNPDHIVSYSVYQTRPDIDVLRIKYSRPKGSILPLTRKYKLGRSKKNETVDSGSRQSVIVYEISPILEKVTRELDTIIKKKSLHINSQEYLKAELKRVQSESKAEIDALKKQIEELSSKDKSG